MFASTGQECSADMLQFKEAKFRMLNKLKKSMTQEYNNRV